MKIIFTTSNKGKFDRLQREFDDVGLHHVQAEQKNLDLTEIQSVDIAEISLFKARQAFSVLQCPVITHDGGFYIEGLNGFPGAYTRDMVDTIGVETIAKIVSVLDNKKCQFRNVATLMYSENEYQQFFDTTSDVFTLTSDIWPHDHEKMWSPLWRILVPSGLGYTKPMASFNEQDMDIYLAKRKLGDGVFALAQCAQFVKDNLTLLKIAA